MSDMRHLLEKMNKFAGERVGQKPGDQVRGSEPMPRKGSKKHPYAGRLVGANESADSLLKELSQVINSDPVKRDLFQEWQEYKQELEIKEGIEIHADPNDPTNIHGWEITVPAGHFPGVDKPVKLKKYSLAWQDEVRNITGRPAPRDPMVNQMYDQLKQNFEKNPYQPGSAKEFKPQEPKQPQDQMVPPADPRNPKGLRWPEWGENETPISEYGAPGSGIGNDTARNPAEEFAKGQERKAAKQQIQGQIVDLIAQLQAARAQLAELNQQFPQGANPVEKTMAMQQMSAQKIQIKKQIEDLTAQIAALRQQAV